MARLSAKKMARRKSVTMATKKSATQSAKQFNGKAFLIKLGYFSFIISTVVGIGFGYQWFDKSYESAEDLMPLKIIEIEGTLTQVSREQIVEKLLSVAQKEKVSEKISEKIVEQETVGFFNSDLLLMEQRIKSIPWVQKVKLRRVWPDKIHIDIKEHRAIAHWNKDALINEFGIIFNPTNTEGLASIPRLSGPDDQLKKMLETFTQLQQIFEASDFQLVELNLNHRYSWSLTLANGIDLEVGREHLFERIERFISLYPLLKRESDLPIAKIDLRYDTGLAVKRLENSKLQAKL